MQTAVDYGCARLRIQNAAIIVACKQEYRGLWAVTIGFIECRDL